MAGNGIWNANRYFDLIAQPFDEVTLDLTLENGIDTKVEEKDH
ncbi:hypothetical protein AAAV51_05255 [Agathobaculum butyriciproducens]